MPKNASASVQGVSKIGGTNGGANWSQPWSRAQALAELCVLPKAYEVAPNLRQRIETELDEAFAGQKARLNGDQELGEHRTSLLKTIALVRQRMETNGLDATQPMYPVLWIRLLLEAGVVLQGYVYQKLGEWRLRCEAKGGVVFALAAPSTKNSRPSSKFIASGPNQRYARTVEELLLRPVGERGKPYSLIWTLHVIPRSQPQDEASIAKPAPVKAATAEAKKPRRKQKTMEHFNKLCGPGTMENLAIALEKEAGSSRGWVVTERNGRYSTELSAGELCKALRRYQGKVLTGSDSTLQKALGAYVTLPRGRPPRKKPLIRSGDI